MKVEMSSFDVFAIVKELQNLRDARINKVFHVSTKELKIQLNIKGFGRGDLTIEVGRRMHLTEYPKPGPKTPSTFAMTLRKYIGNAVLKEIKQIAFDRIIEIKCIGKDGEEFNLIAELFGKGNVVLTNKDYQIITVMKPQRYRDRKLIGKAKYEYPPQRINPFEVSREGLKRIINESKSDLVRTLASPLGLGGLYAEEVCLRSGIKKDKKGVTEDEAIAIFNVLKDLKSSIGKERPVIVFEDGNAIDVIPVKLKIYEGKRIKEFDTFNKAVDEYFTKYEIERVEGIREGIFEKEIGRLENRLSEQNLALKKYRNDEKKYKGIGDLIYANFESIGNVLSVLSDAKKTYPWKEIVKRIEEGKAQIPEARMIKKLLPKEGTVIIELDGTEIGLDIRKTVGENADFYYTRSKRAREKIIGVKEAIKDTEAEIKRIKEKGKEAIEIEEKKPEKRVVKKKEWYEKFRWFFSSDDFLVLGGRDATTNEVLVKKHMVKGDLFVHADIHGAPAVVIKTEGREVPQQTMQESFDFAASYSKAWKHSLFGLDVYWVTPEQVSKTAEHGEYIPKGAFIIRGKKNFGNGRAEVAIGVRINDEIKVIGGPASAIEKHAKYLVRIIPGRKKSKEIAEDIKKRLLEKAGKEDKEKILKIGLEGIQEFLPAGGSEIAEK